MKNLVNIIIKEENPIKYLAVISLIIAALVPTEEINKLGFGWNWVIETYKFQLSIAFPVFLSLYLLLSLIKKNSK
jgi:hypothetical protein